MSFGSKTFGSVEISLRNSQFFSQFASFRKLTDLQDSSSSIHFITHSAPVFAWVNLITVLFKRWPLNEILNKRETKRIFCMKNAWKIILILCKPCGVVAPYTLMSWSNSWKQKCLTAFHVWMCALWCCTPSMVLWSNTFNVLHTPICSQCNTDPVQPTEH